MAYVLVNDAGHGGRDPGACANGLREKDITLSTALLFREALQRSGAAVIMTRETDVLPLPNGTISQDLSHRAYIANRAKANLIVSWHTDSSGKSEVNGVAVWVHPNSSAANIELATQIAAATGQKNRGVKYGDFAVLRETEMDAVLIEAGFITNPTEARNLASFEYRRKQAEAAARVVCEAAGLAYHAPELVGVFQYSKLLATYTDVTKAIEYAKRWDHASVRRMSNGDWLWDNWPKEDLHK